MLFCVGKWWLPKDRIGSVLRGLLLLTGVTLLVDSLGLRRLEDWETGYSRSGYTSIEMWLIDDFDLLHLGYEPGWVGTAELLFAISATTSALLSWRRARDSFTRGRQLGRLQFSLGMFLILFALVATGLGIETARRRAESRSLRSNIVKLYGGEAAIETISSPDVIEVYRLRPFPNGDPPAVRPDDFPIASGPAVFDEESSARLARFLREPANYDWCINYRFACIVQNRLRLRFVRGRQEVWIDYDPESGCVSVHKDGTYVRGSFVRGGLLIL